MNATSIVEQAVFGKRGAIKERWKGLETTMIVMALVLVPLALIWASTLQKPVATFTKLSENPELMVAHRDGVAKKGDLGGSTFVINPEVGLARKMAQAASNPSGEAISPEVLRDYEAKRYVVSISEVTNPEVLIARRFGAVEKVLSPEIMKTYLPFAPPAAVSSTYNPEVQLARRLAGMAEVLSPEILKAYLPFAPPAAVSSTYNPEVQLAQRFSTIAETLSPEILKSYSSMIASENVSFGDNPELQVHRAFLEGNR
jgi:hypothetical protein